MTGPPVDLSTALDWLLPKREEPDPRRRLAELLAQRRADRARRDASAFAPDVSKVQLPPTPFPTGGEPPPELRPEATNYDTRLAQREADRMREEADTRRIQMEGGGALGAVGRTLYSAGKGVAELANLPAALAGRDIRGIGSRLKREADLEREGLISPGHGEPTKGEQTAGGFIGTLPAFELGGAVAGPVSRALARRLVQRGVGKLGSMTERTLLRGAEGLAERGATLSAGSGIQGTAAGLGRGEDVPTALEHGAEAAVEGVDPRHLLTAAILAHGAATGAVRGAGEHISFRDRLRDVEHERASRLLGFGPMLPEEALSLRGFGPTLPEAKPGEPAVPTFVYGEPGRPARSHLMPPPGPGLTPLNVEAQKAIDYMYQRHRDVLEPGIDAELTPEQLARRERVRREVAALNDLRRQPEAGRPLPAGAPKVLGGTEEDIARRAPKPGEPGVLGSGPLLGGSLPEIAAGAVGAAAGYSQGETTEDKLLGALLGSTIGSGLVASARGARGLHSGPLIGGPEAGPNAPFFSRLRRTLETLPENGASPQRLASLQREGRFAKTEYDYVLAHQLEGREPGRLIPRADLLRMHDAEAIRLTETVLPRKPDAAALARNAELVTQRDAARRALEQHSVTSPPWIASLPEGARAWFERHVSGGTQDLPSELERYQEVTALHGTRVTWKPIAESAASRARGNEARVQLTIKAPGRPPVVRRGADVNSILYAHGDMGLRQYVRGTHTWDWANRGDMVVDAPAIPEAQLQEITRAVAERDRERQHLQDEYHRLHDEASRAADAVRGEGVHHAQYGQDESTAGKHEQYQEYLLQMQRPEGRRTYAPPDIHFGTRPDLLFHVRGDIRNAYNTETGNPEKVKYIREIQSDFFQLHGAGGKGMVDERTGKIIAYPRGSEILPQTISEAELTALPPEVKRAVTRSGGVQTVFERQKDGTWQPGKTPKGGPLQLYNEGGNDPWMALIRSERGGHLVGRSAPTRETLQEEMDAAVRQGGVPAAPWRATEEWVKLALRYIVQREASQGIHHIVWTPGALNDWAKRYGFMDFYDKVIPRAFRDIGKELGVELSFEPAPLTKQVINWKIEPVEPDALTPERVVQAWKQVSGVQPWVIQRSATMRQVIGALDHLFAQTNQEYRPLRPPEVRQQVTHEQVLSTVQNMINGDYPQNGAKIQAELGRRPAATYTAETLDNLVRDADANDMSRRYLLSELNLTPQPELGRRTMGAGSHELGAVLPSETIRAELQQFLRNPRPSDQAKTVVLNLLGAKRVEGFEYGPRYHSVRLPENITAQLAGGQRLLGGIPFDPEWLKAVGLPAVTTAVGAGVGAATDKEHPVRGALVGGLAGLGAGVAGGRIREALRARRGTEAGAVPIRPLETPPEPAPGPKLVEPEQPVPAPEQQRLAPRPGGLPVEPPVNPDDYANFAKFDLDPTGKARLQAEVERVVTETGVHPKQVVSWGEVRRAADQLGLDVHGKGNELNRRISGARLLAIRNIISANIDRQEKWAGELANATLPQARRAQLERMNRVLDAQNSNLLGEFVRQRSAAGRELNALKIVANRSLDPSVWLLKAAQLARRELTTDENVDIRRLLNERDRAALVTYVGRLRQSPVSEQLLTLWKAGLLTNPHTHVINVASNTAMAGLETAKDPVAAGFDWLMSLWTQQRTKGGISRLLAETSRHAVGRGFFEAGEVLKGRAVGEDLERGLIPRETVIDLPGLSPGANALLDGYQKYIYRALGASDRVYYHMAVTRSLTEQAVLAGRKMGMRGVVLRDYVHGILRGQGSLADEMTATALKDAAVATFRDQTRLGKAATAFARDVPGGQFIVPFQRTPGAVATRIIEYSPLGLGKGVVDGIRVALKRGDAPVALQRMAAEELGRGTTGSGLIALGYWLGGKGLMTGALPLAAQDRQRWAQEGRRPNALLVDKQWLDIGRLSPVGNLLALGANLRAALGSGGGYSLATPEGAAALLFSGLRTVADQPFVSGVSAFTDALQNPERDFTKFAQGLEGSVVPAGIAAVARATDVRRVPELEAAGPLGSAAGAVAERIPGLRRLLPARRDTFGRTQTNPGVINAIFSPATANPDLRARDPVIRELAEAQYAVPRLPRDKHEGAIAYERRQRIFGAYTHAKITQLLQTGEYANATELERQIAQQAAALAQNPQYAGIPVARIQEALMAREKSAKGSHTRAELLEREVTRVRTALRKELRRAQ